MVKGRVAFCVHLEGMDYFKSSYGEKLLWAQDKMSANLPKSRGSSQGSAARMFKNSKRSKRPVLSLSDKEPKKVGSPRSGNGGGRHQLKYFKMEDITVKVKKKNKTGPLKSTPGFLKCMRNVYLYFKEEKEKGALNIPINSFIERTAVACGVGRKTLYNYAKKGLFDEHPILLQPKQKKKRGKRKIKQEDIQLGKKGKKKSSSPVQTTPGPSDGHPFIKKKESPTPRLAKNAMIQTDPRPTNANENLVIQATNPNTAPDGFTNFIINRDQNKVQQIQVVQQNKGREMTHVLTGPWTTGTTTIKRDVDYFPKNNIWHAVYNLHTTESQTCNAELNAGRMTSCQQQPTSDHLADL